MVVGGLCTEEEGGGGCRGVHGQVGELGPFPDQKTEREDVRLWPWASGYFLEKLPFTVCRV